jgi:DNA-binding response OmpR family regulator
MTKAINSILAIDKDEYTTDLILSTLSSKGFKVHVATGSSDGLSKFIQHKPDLVILNMDTPTNLGFITLRDICEADPHTQVISISLSRNEEMAMECIRHGAKDYLKKPIEKKDLIRSIERIENRKHLLRITSEPDINCVHNEEKRLVFGNDTEALPYIINQAVFNARAICADIENLKTALSEMVLNAIEHGNLNITRQEKASAAERGEYKNLINERRTDPRYAHRVVTLDVYMDHEKLVYTITDQGDGFDYRAIFDADPHAYLGSGLGLFIARIFFSQVVYGGCGNRVKLVYIRPCEENKDMIVI